MPVIKTWLSEASRQLSKSGIKTASLDAEIILATALKVNRPHLHAHPEMVINKSIIEKIDKMIDLRLNRMPIAYIIGHKEFYGRNFIVTKDTLIPRPESEAIIDMLKNIIENTQKPLNLIDIGTGSGCLGITAKLEFPALNVVLADISSKALKVATLNAERLLAITTTLQSDLLSNCDTKIDIIIANLPYVDKSWERSPETNYEPSLALFANNNGKSLIEKLLKQAKKSLKQGGYIIIEADPEQHKELIKFARNESFKLISKQDYVIKFKYQN